MRNRAFVVAAFLALTGCECGEPTETPTTAAPDPVVVAPPPPLPPLPPSGPLTVGGPAVGVELRALPGLTFTLAAAGEYQIDAIGAPLDAELRLVSSDGAVVATDGDSGDDANARIIAFLAAGAYELRVGEAQGRAFEAQVSVTSAEMTPAASYAPGAPAAVVQSPAASSDREASVEVELTIAEAGNFQIDATTVDVGRDAEMQLIQNGVILATDSSSGGGTNARIQRPLEPGTYRVRVRDAQNREAAIVVSLVLLPPA